MDRIKKNFGFGCMRLPMSGDEVDKVQMCQMVDAFLEAGFNYFDTAHGYLQGKSETALRDCLTSRYPRDRYVLTDKLTGGYFKTEADIRPFFQRQLEACGVEYFDFYLMHSQHAGADAGQHRLYEGLPAAGSAGAGRRLPGTGDLPRYAPDPLHLLPLLRGWMSPAHRHPQFVRPDEHQATLPRLERRLLL